MRHRLFQREGVHVIADGQFGSCGKGTFAAWLAKKAIDYNVHFSGVITSAGPNSGHTSYFNDEKIVLKQLPTFAVHSHLRGYTIPVYFSAGAVIDAEVLIREHLRWPNIPIYVHPCAALVTEDDKIIEKHGSVAKVAGTRSGTGAVIARKVLRDPKAVFSSGSAIFPTYYEEQINLGNDRYIMEISQGFSLGLNTREFYPKVTSRECTFAQGLADARMPPINFSWGALCFRTYPIRVGDVDGYSAGGCYADQEETSWDEIGVAPEYTTVTNRQRRVFTWSWNQFRQAIAANRPSVIFLNFMNYLPVNKHQEFIDAIESNFDGSIIGGYGPRIDDIKWL